jgi:hypothetical protein
MFQRLPGMFAPRLVILFVVMRGGSTVSMCGKFVELGSSLVRVILHSVLYPQRLAHAKAFTFSKLLNYGHPRKGRLYMPVQCNTI